MITAFLITVAAVAVILIGWGLSPVERKHRRRKHAKRRQPGTEVEVYLPRHTVSVRAFISEHLRDGRPGWYDKGGWIKPGLIRTAEVQGVHQPLSGDYDSADLPGAFDPHYAWLASQAPNVPRREERDSSWSHEQIAPRSAPGHPRWPMPSRNMSHDVDDTIIDSPPRLCAGRNPGSDPLTSYLLTSHLDSIRSGAWL